MGKRRLGEAKSEARLRRDDRKDAYRSRTPPNATQKKEDRSLSTVPNEGLGRPRERPRRGGATVEGGEILQGQVALTDMVGRGPVLVFLPSRFSVRVCRPRAHRDGDLDVFRVRK